MQTIINEALKHAEREKYLKTDSGEAEDDLLGHSPVEGDVLKPFTAGSLFEGIERPGIDIDPADTAVRPDYPGCRKREEPIPAPDVDEGGASGKPDPLKDGLGVLPAPPCSLIHR